MSFTATSWVLARDTTKGAERLVMISLANHAGDDGCSWPSHKTIAREANLSLATVKRTLSALVDRGILARSINAAPDDRIPKDRRPNLYCLVGFVHDATGGTTTTPREDGRGAQPRRDGGHNHDATGGTNSAPKQSLEPSVQQSLVTTGEYPAAFERFWQVYPQRKAKRAALKAWRAARKRTTEHALIEGARVYAATADRRYYQHPATWLNADAWLDEHDDPNEEPGYVVH